jgi:manganese/zinc/iron transport system substrate-binding protein
MFLALAACGRGGDQGAARVYPYKITTTVGMVTDIVRQVAGEKAVVTGIIGTGVDPHLYKPTRDDVAQLMEADVVCYSGLMLEGKMADTLLRIGQSGKPVHAVTEMLDEQYLLQPAHLPGHHDPHVWMDVQAWSKSVEAAAKVLAEFDAPNAAYYRENARRYAEALQQLDDYARKSIATIPEQQRVLITAHDAFHYFGRAYGLRVLGIQGISTESEAGLEDINRLVDVIVASNVQAVFVETSVAEKNVRALIEGVAARGHAVKIGGSLFSDAMGAPGTYAGTYVGMIDANVTVITRALGGTAPQRGMQGKLSTKD